MTTAEHLRQCTDEQLADALVSFAASWHLALNEKGECWGKDEVLELLHGQFILPEASERRFFPIAESER